MSKYHFCAWTGSEDQKLTEIMESGVRDREKILVLFNVAAKELGRTAKSCQNRWYEIKAREAV
jgi:hypothetical protein